MAMDNIMKTQRMLAGLLFLVVFSGRAIAMEVPTCEQIREQIQAQTGVLPKTNTELLQLLSARQECGFSAAEVYRAAYGDKALPKPETRSHRKHDDDD
jgi:hypothetical protein